MSVVTTIMLHVGTLEDYGDHGEGGVTRDVVNAWLQARSPGYWLQPLDEAPIEYWGGSKAPQVNLWAGAFNVFGVDEESFLAFLAGLRWAYPRDVQLFVRHEDDDRMHVLMLGADRHWVELVDGGAVDCWWEAEPDRTPLWIAEEAR